MRKSFSTLLPALACALAVGVAGPARAGEHGACAVLASPFSLAEIVETALEATPGFAVKAGFTVQPTGEGEPDTLFKVKIRKEEGGKSLQFYDTETGERVFPVAPALTLLEAYDAAVAAVEEAAGAEGATVLKGALHRKVFLSHYDFGIADPEAVLVFARVNALTGEVRLLTPKDLAKHKVKRKIARHKRIYRHISGQPFRCDGIDDEDDPEDEELLDS